MTPNFGAIEVIAAQCESSEAKAAHIDYGRLGSKSVDWRMART